MGIDEDVAKAHEVVKVKLTFPEDSLIVQPLIYDMANRYDVVFNIIKAEVEIGSGWVILEISGINDAIDNALFWLHSLGVIVDLTIPT